MKKLILVALIASLSGCGFTYSDGFRAGTVQKISLKGLIFKTYEGELVMDGYLLKGNQTSTKATNVWNFSVTDKTVFDDLVKSSMNNVRVQLTYEEKLITMPWTSSTSYIVTKVEAVTP